MTELRYYITLKIVYYFNKFKIAKIIYKALHEIMYRLQQLSSIETYRKTLNHFDL